MKPLITVIVIAALSFLFACSEDGNPPKDNTKYLFQATIQGPTQTSLKRIPLLITRMDKADDPITSETDLEGIFQLHLETGTYTISVDVEGYEHFSQTFVSGMKNEHTVITLKGDASLSGQIIHSQTANGLPGATMTFTRLKDGESNEIVPDGVEFEIKSDEQGFFNYSELPKGSFVGTLTMDGFIERTVGDVVLSGEELDLSRVIAVQRPPEGALRIVLSWGATPEDLDSHLFGPSTDGSTFHVYWNNKTPTPEVSLDVDVTTSYGPETLTIAQLLPGTYRYAILNYNHALLDEDTVEKMIHSPTIVEVYDHEQMIATFPVDDSGVLVDTPRSIDMFYIHVTESGYSLASIYEWRQFSEYEEGDWGRMRK